MELHESEKELLRWHQRLGHLDFNKVKHLFRTGVLSNTAANRQLHTAASKLKGSPKCAACLFGKQTVRKAPGSTTSVVKDTSGVLRSGNLHPGQEVLVKGRKFDDGFDRGSDANRFCGGCIFVEIQMAKTLMPPQ